MQRALLALALCAACFGLATQASATCQPPSQPGALICFPTPNATLAYSFSTGTAGPVEGAATADAGAYITAVALYMDGARVYVNYSNSFTSGALNYYWNGWHHLVLNAWDNAGRVYQYSEWVYVVDANVPNCGVPGSGFNLCAPQPGSYWPQSRVQTITTGASNIVNYTLYVNGSFFDSSNTQSLNGQATFPINNSQPYNLGIVATDSSGKKYTKNTSFVEYYDGMCFQSRNGTFCDPGVYFTSPTPYQDVTSPFTLNAEVKNNTLPITAMRAYLDGNAVASSTGPTIYAPITAAHGTHYIVVQAWDTKGGLYRSDETINVQ